MKFFYVLYFFHSQKDCLIPTSLPNSIMIFFLINSRNILSEWQNLLQHFSFHPSNARVEWVVPTHKRRARIVLCRIVAVIVELWKNSVNWPSLGGNALLLLLLLGNLLYQLGKLFAIFHIPLAGEGTKWLAEEGGVNFMAQKSMSNLAGLHQRAGDKPGRANSESGMDILEVGKWVRMGAISGEFDSSL